MKVAMRPEIFPCAEVIGWILPRVNVTKMILSNTEGKNYAAYSTAYVSQAYKLPTLQSYLKEEWLKGLDLDILDNVRRMMVHGNHFRTRPSEEYETAHLRTPYRLIALMLSGSFG